jgi:hypothetical protein
VRGILEVARSLAFETATLLDTSLASLKGAPERDLASPLLPKLMSSSAGSTGTRATGVTPTAGSGSAKDDFPSEFLPDGEEFLCVLVVNVAESCL